MCADFDLLLHFGALADLPASRNLWALLCQPNCGETDKISREECEVFLQAHGGRERTLMC